MLKDLVKLKGLDRKRLRIVKYNQNRLVAKVNRIRLVTPEKVNKCRLHRRYLDDITTPP